MKNCVYSYSGYFVFTGFIIHKLELCQKINGRDKIARVEKIYNRLRLASLHYLGCDAQYCVAGKGRASCQSTAFIVTSSSIVFLYSLQTLQGLF